MEFIGIYKNSNAAVLIEITTMAADNAAAADLHSTIV